MQHDGLRPVDVAEHAAPGLGQETRDTDDRTYCIRTEGHAEGSREVPRLPADRSRRPDLAVQAHRDRADLVLGGFARRQPVADQPDGA